MPSEKSLRSAIRKYQRNRPIKSSLRTYISRAEGYIQSKEIPEAEKAVSKALVVLDKAAQKKIIHPNNAARRKSRLTQKLNFVKAQT